MDLNTIGWVGSILLAGCAIPEAYLAFKNKKSHLSWSFLMMWLFGEIFILIPILLKIKVNFLLLNYSLNIVLILIICYYKIMGEKREKYHKNCA